MKRQLWGKAQQLMTQATQGLLDPVLLRHAWSARAELAEQRGDTPAVVEAWEMAARA